MPGNPTSRLMVMFNAKLLRLRCRPPLQKIALWSATVATLATLIQFLFWVAGLGTSVLEPNGAGVLLSLTLSVVLIMMWAERRTAADYGLSVGRSWRKHAGLGAAIGAAFYAAYVLCGWVAGGIGLRPPSITISTLFSAAGAAVAAMFLAATQQLIFSGYVLSIFRERYRPAVAVTAAALLFGILSQLPRVGQPAGTRLLVSMFLIGALLALLRLRTGSLALSAGLLTGSLVVRRLIRVGAMAVAAPDPKVAAWWAPESDPRQGPLFCVLLTVAVVVAGLSLRRHGERRLEAGVDRTFKELLPFSNLNSLARIDVWLRQLVRARFRVGLKYTPRLAVIMTTSSVNSVLALPERLLAPQLLRHDVPPPLFIVGVHRSGTTHLHNLLSLDSRFVTPRNYHVLNPDGMLTTGWLTILAAGPFMTWQRPMDGVAMHVFSPQEEEFAITNVIPHAPYWSMTFPRRFAEMERLIFPDDMTDRERRAWRSHYRLFLRKLTFWSRRQPLLKSPYNVARVALLADMFPGARFVHIYRHPHDVFRSNMHLAREGFSVFRLQDAPPENAYESRFLANYRRQVDTFYRDTRQLPREQVAEVRFEDLEQDPLVEVRRIYETLGIPYDGSFHRRLNDYLESLADYRKNHHPPLKITERRAIDRAMGDYLDRWGYAARAHEAVA